MKSSGGFLLSPRIYPGNPSKARESPSLTKVETTNDKSFVSAIAGCRCHGLLLTCESMIKIQRDWSSHRKHSSFLPCWRRLSRSKAIERISLEDPMVATLRKRIGRSIAVVALAMAAGQFVQSTAKPTPKPKLASAELSVKPTKLETVAAGELAVMPPVAPAPLRLPTQTPINTAANTPATADVPEKALGRDECPASLDLSVTENAMLGVTLIAGCHPNERVILKHAGLAISAKTTLTGAVFADLPALQKSAEVEVLFKDGSRISSSIDVPEIASVRRFAIQWQADDAFQLHGFENGAGYGDKGDVSGANPNRPASGVPALGGFISVLGDSTTETPLLAEVYTYPTDASANPDVVVEAAVTPTTCGRELLGETLLSLGGTVTTSDLTVAMPECDAIGDYLVLNNLVPDMNIASSE
jgi:hypothetical protein